MNIFKVLFNGLKDGLKDTVGQYIFMGIALVVGALLIWHFIIPDMETMKEWFGADTKAELKVKLNNANISVLDLTNKNAVCERQLKDADSSCKVQLKALQATMAYQQKANDDLATQNGQRAKKIKDIQKQAAASDKSTVNAAMLNASLETKISEVQIDALWESYCAKNTSDECPAEQGETK